MTARVSAVSRTLFQHHDYRVDAWFGVVISAGSALAAGLITTPLLAGDLSGWPMFVMPIILVFLLNMSGMFAFAAMSCDPESYGDRKPWMLGLFGNDRAKPTFLEQALNWATHSGRGKLMSIANS